ncbi:MAG TPA: hypothetical protein VKV40_10890 [Ktedonobacteraceae bacterium]|nr:hypothetical protein [Ktedonobacteraceae bacterium]
MRVHAGHFLLFLIVTVTLACIFGIWALVGRVALLIILAGK